MWQEQWSHDDEEGHEITVASHGDFVNIMVEHLWDLDTLDMYLDTKTARNMAKAILDAADWIEGRLEE